MNLPRNELLTPKTPIPYLANRFFAIPPMVLIVLRVPKNIGEASGEKFVQKRLVTIFEFIPYRILIDSCEQKFYSLF